jgi:hypothetical protein
MSMIGKTLAHYEILSPMGSRSMGDVRKARDTRLGRIVAIQIATTPCCAQSTWSRDIPKTNMEATDYERCG